MKTCIIICLILFSSFVFGSLTGDIKIEGVVVKHNKRVVTLLQNGKKVKVPRSSIPKHIKIKPGNTVYAVLDKQKLKKKLDRLTKKEVGKQRAKKTN